MAKPNKIVRNGKTLIVVLGSNGKVLTHNNCTDEMYNKIVNAETDEEIQLTIEPVKTEVVKKVESVKKEADDFQAELSKSKVLSTFHSSIYWKEVCEVSLPIDFAKAVLTAEREGNSEYLQALKNFWVLCSLNPDSRARNNLFWFLQRYGFKISSNGLFVAYRNVELKSRPTMTKTIKKVKKVVEREVPVEVEVEEEIEVAVSKKVGTINQDNSLNAFISSEFTRVRFKLKKSAKNYFVGRLEDGTYLANPNKDKVGKYIGILSELYEGLMNAKPEDVLKAEVKKEIKKTTKTEMKTIQEEIEVEEEVEIPQSATVYTDSYTKKMSIMIGQPVSIDRSKCNPNQQQTCSHGLHVAGRSWLKDGYLGTISLVVLVNPADVVAVPPEDSYGKMRVCTYFPLAVVERDEKGNIIDLEFENGFDADFVKVVTEGYSVNNNDEVKNYTLTVPSVYEFEPRKLQKNLDEIKKNLSKKIT